MIDLTKIDELANRLTQALPPAARTMSDEAQAQFKAVLRKGLASMDVVTREDFEQQKAALGRAEEKLKALESRLADLEAGA
jgi:BMFP domain-containing protein YqiC